ncbi:unnamed protein product [Prunus armeniaca]
MGKKTKKTKKPGKGKEKAAKAEEKRARRETSSSHLRMTSMPFRVMDHLRAAEIVCGSFKLCWENLPRRPPRRTIWHYHGGCQVGRVVDKGYGVLGIDSLRVIDGSTFCHTPGANPEATVMMLGRQVDSCNWTGVVRDNLTGHVGELHRGNYYSDEYLNYSLYQENSLGGMIPSFLGSLRSLRYLNLSDSKFAGIIPHQLGNLSSLRSLGLRSKSYYWMKVENLQWLSGLSSLQNLDMSRVDLSKASDWFQVTNTLPSMLVELHVSSCELNQIPVGVANMTRLEVLNLSNIESLSHYLNLLRGEISSSIGNLTAIVNLDLSANQLKGKIPNSLGNLCNLTVLGLSRNYFNGSVSEILGNLSRCSSGEMESLKLSTNDFSAGKFQPFTPPCSFEYFNIRSNSSVLGKSNIPRRGKHF